MTYKTRQRFGSFTVVSDYRGAKHIRLRCDCGRENDYSRYKLTSKYKGPLMCDVCAGVPCEVCGSLIPRSPRMQKLTCSEKCFRERNSQREKQRYSSVKDTEHWHGVRRKYLQCIKDRMQDDPEFSNKFRLRARQLQREYIARLTPDELEQRREENRLRMRQYLARLRENPEAHQARLERTRNWYRSLSIEEKLWIYTLPLLKKKPGA